MDGGDVAEVTIEVLPQLGTRRTNHTPKPTEKPMRTTSLIAAVAAATIGATGILSAQSAVSGQGAHWEINVPSGTVLPTGTLKDEIKRGNLSAIQLTYVVNPVIGFTATGGWARSRDMASAETPKLDVFTYDVGAEFRAARVFDGKAVSFAPFTGVGAGGRSYTYRSGDRDATHTAGGYMAVGGDVGISRLHLRLEARDYVTRFKPLDGRGAVGTRNDVMLMLGLRYVRNPR